MRPVTKWTWPQVGGAQKSYNPHTIAKTDLELNFDTYCSYCEVFSSDLEVEHVISRNQNPTLLITGTIFYWPAGAAMGETIRVTR
jgi:5-methylcytosine-specific restriction endonuclease McrA